MRGAVFDTITRTGARFARDRAGGVALIFALALVPLLLAVGAATDYTRMAHLRERLQTAVDTAGLTTGRFITTNPAATEAQIQGFAAAQLARSMEPDRATLDPIAVERGRTRLSLTARATYRPRFLGIARALAGGGDAGFGLSATTVIGRGTGTLEIALVLDNTGSMNTNNRIGRLREAATLLVDILEGARAPEREIRVALVPFVTAVNVQGEGFKWDWIDRNAAARHHGENFDPPPGGGRVNHLSLFAAMRDQFGRPIPWKGCVETRPEPHDIQDTPPSASNPDTLFVPYLWPDEPERDHTGARPLGYANSYMLDAAPPGTTVEARQSSTAKYVPTNQATVNEADPMSPSPNGSCAAPIVPLTTDYGKVRAGIARMQPWYGSGTNIAEGLAWGERVLSPEEPYTKGAPWGGATVQRVIVLLTDGDNKICCQNAEDGQPTTHNRSDYSSVGFLAKRRLGTDSSITAGRKLLEKMGQICTRLRAPGGGRDPIQIYTITFDIPSASLREAFRACATRPDMAYDSAATDQIKQVFETIAWELASLRIIR